MLVLSRKTGQRIQIGDNISITVMGVRGERVQLGFDAPRQVTVRRLEIGVRPTGGCSQRHDGASHDQEDGDRA